MFLEAYAPLTCGTSQTPACMRAQGNLRTDLVSGTGWDQLVLPMGTCVSYVKDLAPLAFNDQARRASVRRVVQGEHGTLHAITSPAYAGNGWVVGQCVRRQGARKTPLLQAACIQGPAEQTSHSICGFRGYICDVCGWPACL